MQIGGTSTQTTNGTILKVITSGGTLPTDSSYGIAIGTERHGLVIETTQNPATNNAVLWVKNDGTGETILRSDNYNITTVGDNTGGNFSLNYNRYHGSAYLQTGAILATSGYTIDITTVFKNIIPGPGGSGSAWGITGKLLAFRNIGGDTEYREFYITRDAGNAWSSTQFSPAGSVTGAATSATVSG